MERSERLAAFQDMRDCHTNSFQILHDHVEDNQVKTGQEISKLWAVLNSVQSPNSQATSFGSSSASSGSGFTSGLNSDMDPMSASCDANNEADADIDSVFNCESIVLLPPTLHRECTIQRSVPVPMVEVAMVASAVMAVSPTGAHPEDPELEIGGSVLSSVPTSTSIPRILRSNIVKKIPGHRKKTTTCEYCKNEVGKSYLGRHKKNACMVAKYMRSVGQIA